MPQLNHSKTAFSKIVTERLSFKFGFTTKLLGDARKDETIEQLIQVEELHPQVIVRPKQSHSTTVQVIEELPKERFTTIPECDGLITKIPGVMLTVMTADCVPVVYVDQKAGIVAVSHQGWKGSLERMAEKTVTAMVAQGADLKRIECWLGPSIGACCYDVPKERYTLFKDAFFTYYHLFAQKKGDKFYLNLNELNVQQLMQAGVLITNIQSLDQCTSCERNSFYSYRRDSTESFGEILSYVIIE